MEFSPTNRIVKLCIQAMALEAGGNIDEAGRVFLQAWEEASSDLEKFIAAHAIARNEKNAADKLRWFETALQFALSINDESVTGVFPSLYTNIAECHEELHNLDRARENRDLAASFSDTPTDAGPFYHGTKADLKIGDLLNPGGISNYNSEIVMNHIYFTALLTGAGLAAMLAKGDGRERVYIVEPTGSFEHDPNVTDKKFPGNLTRSYRSSAPLKIIGEVENLAKQPSEELRQWREKLAKNTGEIIN